MCMFCSGGRDDEICSECLKVEDKLNIWHIVHSHHVKYQKYLSREEKKLLVKEYFVLKKKNYDVQQIGRELLKK